MPVAHTDRRRQDRYGNLAALFYHQQQVMNRPVRPAPAPSVPGVIFVALLMCGLGIMTQGWQNLLFVRLVENAVGHETCYDTWRLATDYVIPEHYLSATALAAEIGRPFYYATLGLATILDTIARILLFCMTLRSELLCDTNHALNGLPKPPSMDLAECVPGLFEQRVKSDPPTFIDLATYFTGTLTELCNDLALLPVRLHAFLIEHSYL